MLVTHLFVRGFLLFQYNFDCSGLTQRYNFGFALNFDSAAEMVDPTEAMVDSAADLVDLVLNFEMDPTAEMVDSTADLVDLVLNFQILRGVPHLSPLLAMQSSF